jgi:hypothetical protein
LDELKPFIPNSNQNNPSCKNWLQTPYKGKTCQASRKQHKHKETK